MRRIVVINAKGGCGKTTVATNLASWYAAQGYNTALFDYDFQASSTRWLSRRPETMAPIHGVAAYHNGQINVTRAWQLRVPHDTQRVIVDTPAGLKGRDLVSQIQGMDCILIPVLPSPIDIQSTADFIRDLLLIGRVRERNMQLGIVANRIKANTLSFQALERFLATLKIPVVMRLRDTQHYVTAVDQGCGIHELKSSQARQDLGPWAGLMKWTEAEPALSEGNMRLVGVAAEGSRHC